MPTDPPSRSAGVRERTRAAMTQEIVDTARRRLASDGAAALSLRAVARELGMSSSAVYRYVPSRDDLLTTLIVEAYDSLGAAAERAEETVARADIEGRFRAIARAVRRWAIAHEHEYALVYGSPVPGYRAPQATIPPATRVPRLLVQIIRDGLASGALRAGDRAVPEPALDSMAPIRAAFDEEGAAVPPDLVARGLMAWTYIFGAVSFDLFGHRHNVLLDERAADHPFFEQEVDYLVDMIGLGDTAMGTATATPDPIVGAGQA